MVKYLLWHLQIYSGQQRPALLGINWLSDLKFDWAQLNEILHNPIEQLLARCNHVIQPGVGTVIGYQTQQVCVN